MCRVEPPAACLSPLATPALKSYPGLHSKERERYRTFVNSHSEHWDLAIIPNKFYFGAGHERDISGI